MADPYIRLEERGHKFKGFNKTDEPTRDFIKSLILENSVQGRIATILLASFNIAAAMMIIISILYDAWRVSRRRRILTLSSP
jgi:hypothetical protein